MRQRGVYPKDGCLRELRRQKELSQPELARLAYVHLKSVHKAEKAEERVDKSMLECITDKLGVNDVEDVIEKSPIVIVPKDLDNRYFSHDVWQEFERRGITLSQSVSISVQQKGSKWLATDKESQQTYVVRQEEDKLNICEQFVAVPTDSTLRRGPVYRSAFVSAFWILVICFWFHSLVTSGEDLYHFEVKMSLSNP